MKRYVKPIQAVLLLAIIAALTGCNLGQAAEPTPTAVDVNAVMTSAASTAFAQLTEIAALATPTTAPVEATVAPAQTATNTLEVASPASQDAQPTVTATIQIAVETPVISVELTPTLALPGLPTNTLAPTNTPAPVAGAVDPGPVCKKAMFVEDVTVLDGTAFEPWEKFTKIWRFQNVGTCRWDEGYFFKAFAGNAPSMTDGAYNIKDAVDFVEPGETVDVGIKMYAPGDPGEYIAHWSWYDDAGAPFPQSVTVVIKVK